MIKLVVFLLAVCSFFQETCSGRYYETLSFLDPSIKEKIETIPREDRVFLDSFFSELITKEGLGYTLFGTKPICLSGYFVQVPIGNMLMGCDSFVIRKGWEVWEKYEQLFPHPNFLIFKENQVRSNKNIHPIYFVNIRNLLNILNENRKLFEKELSNDFDPEKFLITLNEKQSLSKTINFHEGLLGVLLGYGSESSMKYYLQDLARCSFQLIQHEDYNLQPVSGNNLSSIDFIYPIYFAGDPTSEEVKNILEQNAKERAYLQEIYSNGHFLEITLHKLAEK